MTTTTSTTSPVPEPGPPVDGAAAPRPVRLIHTGSTTEIPVHLLFRDDAGPAPVRLRPAVVGRRPGTAEQPEDEERAGERAGPRQPAAVRSRQPVRPRRSAPRVDPDLVERPARVLPGNSDLYFKRALA